MTEKTDAAPWGKIPPAFDLRKLFDKIELPELGARFMDTRRKDIEALVEANREAYRALESLGQRQQEILRAALKAWQEGAREVIAAPKLGDKASTSVKRSQQAFGQALTDLRELAEMALQSNQQVLSVLNERVQQRLSAAGLGAGKGKAARKVIAEAVADDAPQARPPSRRKPAPPRTARSAPARKTQRRSTSGA